MMEGKCVICTLEVDSGIQNKKTLSQVITQQVQNGTFESWKEMRYLHARG